MDFRFSGIKKWAYNIERHCANANLKWISEKKLTIQGI